MIAEKALREGLVAALDMVIDLDSRVEQLEALVNMLCSEPWEAPCAEDPFLPAVGLDPVTAGIPPAKEVAPPVVMAPIPEDRPEPSYTRSTRFFDPDNGEVRPWHVVAPRGAAAVVVGVTFKVDEALPELPYDVSYSLFRLYSDKNPPLFLRVERNRVYAAVGNGRIELDASILPGQTYEVVLRSSGWLMMRSAKAPQSIDGGTVTQVTSSLYLILALDDHVVVKFKE